MAKRMTGRTNYMKRLEPEKPPVVEKIKEPDLRDIPAVQFEKKAGRERIVAMLESKQDDKFTTLFGMMTGERFARMSFQGMMKASGVTLHDMMELYNDSCRMEAMMAMSAQLPAVAEDIAEDARSVMVKCGECGGAGVIPVAGSEAKECRGCGGGGWTRRAGNKQARDLMFQSAGFTKTTIEGAAQMSLGADMDGNIEGLLKLSAGIVVKVGS